MKKFVLFLAFVGFIGAACSNDDDNKSGTGDCTDVVMQGLEVTVKDGAATLDGTQTTVTATDGDYIEELQFSNGIFIGAYERQGTYTITVTADGYQPYASEPVTVDANECHVITQEITVNLEPNEG